MCKEFHVLVKLSTILLKINFFRRIFKRWTFVLSIFLEYIGFEQKNSPKGLHKKPL